MSRALLLCLALLIAVNAAGSSQAEVWRTLGASYQAVQQVCARAHAAAAVA